jgi:hypothetical protein
VTVDVDAADRDVDLGSLSGSCTDNVNVGLPEL